MQPGVIEIEDAYLGQSRLGAIPGETPAATAVRLLRKIADIIEREGYPKVYER